MINELVAGASTYADLLSSVNFYFMPVINPDGYAYTFSNVSVLSLRESMKGTL